MSWMMKIKGSMPLRGFARGVLGVVYAFTAMFAGTLRNPIPEVVVHEICWMGTAASPSDEWIELKSNVDRDLSLEGWKLEAEDGTPVVVLSGVLSSRGFYLLERTDDETVGGISADLIYSGTLENGGEILRLIDDAGRVIDSVPCPDGWPAGSTAPSYATMERINPERSADASNWRTNDGVTRNGFDASGNPLCGTPRAPNSATRPPTAQFEFRPSTPTVWDEMAFLDGSTDVDGTVLGWSWAFGDEATSNTDAPTHRFPAAGTRLVTLCVEDNDGLIGCCEREISVVLGRGDLDGDGAITVIDVRICYRLALGLPTEADAAMADIDLDGDVDSLDVQALANFLLGS